MGLSYYQRKISEMEKPEVCETEGCNRIPTVFLEYTKDYGTGERDDAEEFRCEPCMHLLVESRNFQMGNIRYSFDVPGVNT